MYKYYMTLLVSLCWFYTALAQTEKTLIIEKTIQLQKPYTFDDHTWYNAAVSIDVGNLLKTGNSAKIISMAYWVGAGKASLKQYKKEAKRLKPFKAEDLSQEMFAKSVDTTKLDVTILRSYTDESYDCEKKYLEGGFIVYRIDSDCYWHQARYTGAGFAKTDVLAKDKTFKEMSDKKISFVVRANNPVDKVYVKIWIKVQ